MGRFSDRTRLLSSLFLLSLSLSLFYLSSVAQYITSSSFFKENWLPFVKLDPGTT